MTPRSPKGMRNRSVAALGEVLPQVTRDLALDQKVREFAVLSLWPAVVGQTYRERTRAVRLKARGGCHELWVKVKDAATAGDLSFTLSELMRQLNAYAPQTGITLSKIHLSIGQVDG